MVVHLRHLTGGGSRHSAARAWGVFSGVECVCKGGGEESVNSDSNPRRHPDTAFRPVGDEGGLVVIPGRSEVKVLNPVAMQ